MKTKLPAEVLEILKKFEKAGFEIYVVGGAVRDLLMARFVNDWDFTTNATPKQIQKLFKDSFYDNVFGTVGVPAKTKDFKPHEITTFRKEFGYKDYRRPKKVKWGKTLKEDLERRDFTINAMALIGQKIIDPHQGQSDLKNRLIRAVGDPQERFGEDALRMMRAVRIAAQLGFKIEEKTLQAINSNVKLINKIAKERVRDELLKTVASPHPYKGIILLQETGLMQEILPELEKTFGVEQRSPKRHHIYDVGTHSLLSLKNCRSPHPIVRLATLIHDIGKPQTFRKQADGIITFYNHEVVGAAIAKRIATRLRLSKKQTTKLVTLVRWHQFTVNEQQTDAAIRRFIKRVGIENVQDMLILRVADRLGGGAKETSWRLEEFKKRLIEVQKEPFSVRDLKISGHDVIKILNLKPGPKVGQILEKLFSEVEAKKLSNDKKVLIKRTKELRD
jgi:tRNA nucleotidyltransferase (CCA-adding enzyme)